MSKKNGKAPAEKKRVRKILAAEFAKLRALAAPADVAYEAVQDAQLVFNERKAALESVAIHYQRYAGFLVKRYRLKADEQIDPLTGEIGKIPPKREPVGA